MYQEIREKAEKKVEAKLSFYICTIVFSFSTVVLLMLSYYLPEISFWLMLPIPAFLMVLAILFLMAFGLPVRGEIREDWQEEEIQKEMAKLYRQKKVQLPPLEELSEKELLELLELERIKNDGLDWEKDLV